MVLLPADRLARLWLVRPRQVVRPQSGRADRIEHPRRQEAALTVLMLKSGMRIGGMTARVK